MSRLSFGWIVGGMAVGSLAAITLWLGFTIMPPQARAEAVGTIVPWFVTWGFLWTTTLIALVLAGHILRLGMIGRRSK